MLWFRSCPRCKGDLMERSDSEGIEVTCVQCGHELTGADIARLKLRLGIVTHGTVTKQPATKAA